MAGPLSVVLADDDVLVRDVLRAACADRDVPVVAETASGGDLLRLCAELRPAVTISGDRLGTQPIETLMGALLECGTRVIVLSSDPSPERLTTVLVAGASGYLLYDTAPQEVAAGVLAVARGAAALNPTVAGAILRQWRQLRTEGPLGTRGEPVLTPRETEVLAAMADGLATKGIAARLGVATKTVENHKIRVFEKLAVRTQAQAVSVAIGYGLVPGADSGVGQDGENGAFGS
jgi:DNA-binding NarL/FixJ family response regulator